MGIFGKKDKPNEGGLMDAIRCDETDYVIWKWRPAGVEVNTTKKENAIRYGSSDLQSLKILASDAYLAFLSSK